MLWNKEEKKQLPRSLTIKKKNKVVEENGANKRNIFKLRTEMSK